MILVVKIENKLKGATGIYIVPNPVNVWHCIPDAILLSA